MEGNRGYYTENEWILDTEGVNLLNVMCHPDVDYTRTVSNHLIEIIDVLGIEAARNALMKVPTITASISYDQMNVSLPLTSNI